MKFKLPYTLVLAMAIVFVVAKTPVANTSAAPVMKKSFRTKQGDNAFNLFDFYGAITYYSKALKCPKKREDTLYLIQKIADSYRQVNDPANSAVWYQKLVDKKVGDAMNIFWYAEALRANQNYALAKKYYQAFKAAKPADKSVDEILAGIDNLNELSKDKGLFRIDLLGVNTGQSDFGPTFYKDKQIFFTSNRNGRRNANVIDNWSTHNFYQIYVAAPDSGTSTFTKAKSINGCKPNGKFHDGPTAYSAANNELIFTRSNYVNSTAKTSGDKRTVNLKLYSMQFPDKKKKIVSLPFNSNEYSNAHPALSLDGKTLYFSSDKPGGQGGTDLYVTTRGQNGAWAEPKNLGASINSKYDEKFPFIGADGTLYFSSNALDGLGGLDIYKSKMENGTWSKPENVGAPINSSHDDFTFVIDSANKYGYFASNRAGGMGDDDIYHFIYDATKLDYKITVRVVDAITQQPIPMAALAVDCKTAAMQGLLADKNGESIITLKGGKPCLIAATSTGYKVNSKEVSIKDKNGVVIIPLKQDLIKLIVTVREKETLLPIPDVAISLLPLEQPSINYATADNGGFETTLSPGKYALVSPDYSSIKGHFSETDVDSTTGVVKLDFLIPREEMTINVPLTANCFTSTVTITNLKTGAKNEVNPNTKGEVRLDLKLNNRYSIAHNGRVDTISTMNLKPGMTIEGPCKFYVGQTWIIRNIYYDLDKSFIRKDAAKELDNLVRVMKENPTLEVELSSHTDCRSSAKYNMSLSARRAVAAVNYIVAHGVKSNRIIAVGYGETQLTNDCPCEPTNVSNCSEEQHQSNRRTQVKVLRY